MHRHERRPRPGTRLVDCLGDQLLARAGFTLDQDRRPRGRHESDAFDHLAEFLGISHDLLKAEPVIQTRVQLFHLNLERLRLQCALDQDFQLLQVHGLCQKIERSAFHCLHRGFNVPVGGHHDDDRPARQGKRLVDDLESRFSRHAQVSDNHIVLLRLHQIERFIRTARD